MGEQIEDEKNKFFRDLADRVPLADCIGKQIILDGKLATITEYDGSDKTDWSKPPI